MPPRTPLFLAAALLALWSAGCSAPVIRLSWNRPPALPLTTAQRVAVEVARDGASPTPSGVLGAAIGLTQGQVMNKDLAMEPLRLELTGQLQGLGFTVVDKAQADAVIRMVPKAWSYQLEPSVKSLTAGRGRLDVAVEVFDTHGQPGQPIFRDGYWASDFAEHLGEPEVMVRASGRVVARFLEELQPQRVSTKVEMDDTDPVVKPGLDLCRSDQFEAAYLALSQAVSQKPDSAPALYDLGVLAEIRGSYPEAEDLIRRATAINPKPLYFSALERVRRRRAELPPGSGR
jgi:tetratricopeptide (TPR) repeat protein